MAGTAAAVEAVEAESARKDASSEPRAPRSLGSGVAEQVAGSDPGVDDTAEPPIMGHPVGRRH